MKGKPELLSPAGSWEAMCAAVQNGADAVYLGGSRFSARAGAANFDDTAMEKAVEYCHLRGVAVNVALNTLLKQQELAAAVDYAAFLYEIGVDAIIVQDLGLAQMLRLSLPDFPLHASTQMTVLSTAGTKALEKMGFKRGVLARELTEGQIARIRRGTELELEVFVHGALCYCYSGQCLFSSMLGGRSGNRGRCAQPCRLPYELVDESGRSIKSGHLLSPKDLCLLERVGELQAMGINSLKIEGRLKRPEYVGAVTQVYRKYLDNPSAPSRRDMDILADAFNRSGFTQGFYRGERGAEMMSYRTPSNVAPETFPEGIERTFHPDANLRKVSITGRAVLRQGQPSTLTLRDADGNEAVAFGPAPEAALSQSLDRERAARQLSKFGATPFELKDFALELEEGLNLPIGALNALRRDAADQLSAKRINRFQRERQAASVGLIGGGLGRGQGEAVELSVQVRTLSQARAVLPYAPKRIYAPPDTAAALSGEAGNSEIVTRLPDIMMDENGNLVDRIGTKSVQTGIFGLGAQLAERFRVYGDFRLNLYNAWAVHACCDAGFDTVTLSPELTVGELARTLSQSPGKTEVVAYGHLPLMVVKNCVIRAYTGKCARGKDGYVLRDRKNERLPLLCEPDSCVNLLYNAKPLYMADKVEELSRAGVSRLRLDFTIESPERCAQVMRAYCAAVNGEKIERLFSQNEFTRGHFYRGIL